MPNHWVSYAIVDQQWKLVANKDLSYVELYNISEDIFEKKNLKENHPKIVNSLIEKIKNWQNTLPEKPNKKLFSKGRTSI